MCACVSACVCVCTVLCSECDGAKRAILKVEHDDQEICFSYFRLKSSAFHLDDIQSGRNAAAPWIGIDYTQFGM